MGLANLLPIADVLDKDSGFTTSLKLAPAFLKAFRIVIIEALVWRYGSPVPTITPFSLIDVVPETWIWFPMRTAREYPTIGSQGLPEEIFFRGICHKAPLVISSLSVGSLGPYQLVPSISNLP